MLAADLLHCYLGATKSYPCRFCGLLKLNDLFNQLGKGEHRAINSLQTAQVLRGAVMVLPQHHGIRTSNHMQRQPATDKR